MPDLLKSKRDKLQFNRTWYTMITAAVAHYEYIKRARPYNEYIQRHALLFLSMAVATAAEQCQG
jgi:hypothetical protein